MEEANVKTTLVPGVPWPEYTPPPKRKAKAKPKVDRETKYQRAKSKIARTDEKFEDWCKRNNTPLSRK